MGWYDNVVDAAEDYGFSNVGTLELDNEAYQYYMVAVLKNEQGYYLITDSGCSCPSPFENATVEGLTGPLTAEQAREEVNSLAEAQKEDKWSTGPYQSDVDELLALIV